MRAASSAMRSAARQESTYCWESRARASARRAACGSDRRSASPVSRSSSAISSRRFAAWLRGRLRASEGVMNASSTAVDAPTVASIVREKAPSVIATGTVTM